MNQGPTQEQIILFDQAISDAFDRFRFIYIFERFKENTGVLIAELFE